MRTNFMNPQKFVEFARDERIEVIPREAWPEV
jgi:hypothetical protein